MTTIQIDPITLSDFPIENARTHCLKEAELAKLFDRTEVWRELYKERDLDGRIEMLRHLTSQNDPKSTELACQIFAQDKSSSSGGPFHCAQGKFFVRLALTDPERLRNGVPLLRHLIADQGYAYGHALNQNDYHSDGPSTLRAMVRHESPSVREVAVAALAQVEDSRLSTLLSEIKSYLSGPIVKELARALKSVDRQVLLFSAVGNTVDVAEASCDPSVVPPEDLPRLLLKVRDADAPDT